MTFLNPAAFLLLLQPPTIVALALLLFLPDVAIRRIWLPGAIGRDGMDRRDGEITRGTGSAVPEAARFGGRGRRA